VDYHTLSSITTMYIPKSTHSDIFRQSS